MPKRFILHSNFKPKGDQPQAIEKLTAGLKRGEKDQVLLGVTGSGKTFTIANVIANYNKPTLVISPNKTLAAQLYGEFRTFFPENAIEYFVSYYDYYQPEAYIPQTDTYIAKDARINDEIDRMRHSATRSLFERQDVLIVASVSCIYGLGSAEAYFGLMLLLEKGMKVSRDFILKRLIDIHYTRNDYSFERGVFRIRGDVIEVFPSYAQEKSLRIELFGDEIEALSEVNIFDGKVICELEKAAIFPNSHYVATQERLYNAIKGIKEELKEQLAILRKEGKLFEAENLERRTLYDLELLTQMGYCPGIENYSRHLTGREKGEPPPTLLDYFPQDFLVIIDESHITIPQLNGMWRGDRSRKETLVQYGFRLPSAIDNRPLTFDEFLSRVNKCIYVSATPGEWEMEISKNNIVEQIIRPTGLIDPEIEVRPVDNQVDDLLNEIQERVKKGERVLVTTLTKRMAEHLAEYYREIGIKVHYLHSDIDTLERVEVINDLRKGNVDCVIGINLLREGLDLPEVSLVAIFDASVEGFLRSERSLIQTFGRAARNINGTIIMYAENITPSMQRAIWETERRRKIQKEFNEKHKITPKSIERRIFWFEQVEESGKDLCFEGVKEIKEKYSSLKELKNEIELLKKEMFEVAENLQFEKAAKIRDKIKAMEKLELVLRGEG